VLVAAVPLVRGRHIRATVLPACGCGHRQFSASKRELNRELVSLLPRAKLSQASAVIKHKN
jgi:hypothetical protein